MIGEALANEKREMVCLSEAFTMILCKNQSKNWPAKDTNLTFNLQQTQHAYSWEDRSHIDFFLIFHTIWKTLMLIYLPLVRPVCEWLGLKLSSQHCHSQTRQSKRHAFVLSLCHRGSRSWQPGERKLSLHTMHTDAICNVTDRIFIPMIVVDVFQTGINICRVTKVPHRKLISQIHGRLRLELY